MSPRQRLALIAAAVAVLAGTFVVASGSGDDDDSNTTSVATTTTQTATSTETTATETTTTTGTGTTTTESPTTGTTTTPQTPPKPPTPTLILVDGKPRSGVKKLVFDKGERVRFRVRSDVSDEIHVHGYDIKKDVEAGGSVTFDFEAKIDGRFEVELEERAEQIAQLEVSP